MRSPHMCDTDSPPDNSVSARQEDPPSPTSQLGSKIWLTGPVCSPYRLCLASLLSGVCFLVFPCHHIIILFPVRSHMQAMSGKVMRNEIWPIAANFDQKITQPHAKILLSKILLLRCALCQNFSKIGPTVQKLSPKNLYSAFF